MLPGTKSVMPTQSGPKVGSPVNLHAKFEYSPIEKAAIVLKI